MVIVVKCDDWEFKGVFVDQGSSADILYWEAFERLPFDPEYLNPFRGSLVGFSREHAQLKGYMTLRITFGEEDYAKEIKVSYLVIDVPSLLNMIIWRPTFNRVGEALSTLYLCMKYLFPNNRLGIIQVDREIARKCYA